jgi:hypothetical protein
MSKAQALKVDQLSEGWSFKQSDDTSKEAWMPVKKVPTNVHLDLIDNGKYVLICELLDMVWSQLTHFTGFRIPS